MSNPWKARHIGAETVFNGGNFDAACTAVDLEYSGREFFDAIEGLAKSSNA